MLYEVIIDAGETANKCTIAPLSYRPDFRLLRVAGAQILGPLQASILLHHEGECLSVLAPNIGKVDGIASIDCVWRRLDVILRRIAGTRPLLARIPAGFTTAYPRRSKAPVDNPDPEGGLATIEAIFVAAAMLGHWDPSLLSEYYFGRKFIELNRTRFLELGVVQAGCDANLPELSPRWRSALQRRRDRGRS